RSAGLLRVRRHAGTSDDDRCHARSPLCPWRGHYGPGRVGAGGRRQSVTIRLMLVDDHRMLRQGLRRSLEEEGFYVVGEAADGDEAVRLVPAAKPDVILMDVSMPDMDGVEATRRILHDDPDKRIVMLTM